MNGGRIHWAVHIVDRIAGERIILNRIALNRIPRVVQNKRCAEKKEDKKQKPNSERCKYGSPM